MDYCLIIPGRLAGLNEMTASNRTHWAKGASLKKEETQKVADEARKQLSRVKITEPVLLEIVWYEKNNKRDIDNIASGVKFILDGLVEAGVLVNDSQKYVKGLVHSFALDRFEPRIEIKIKAV